MVHRRPEVMFHWLKMMENALCWTCLAPLVRARRTRSMHAFAAEYHDRQRIDRLLNELMASHSDLLS